MQKALLAFCVTALLGAAAPAVAQSGRDFSGGITNASSIPVAGSGADAEWKAKQKATEAAAEAALKSAVVQPRASLAPGQLGPGDKIRMTVFGEEDLSGEFEIDNTGSLSLPLVGEISARGLTQRELEKKLATVLEEGYLKSPRVNIEVLNFRPFFILGEVNKPGSYPYANDMNVINAVALGGGYTTRAKTGKVLVRRATSPEKEEWLGEDAVVYPGDLLRVEERFF
ncbi:MAG: polysaccharide export protein [Alphaproteobacteria bacterium]|nr:MAG: polysaccharide export protein [Alphaproteobacteria bacterium]